MSELESASYKQIWRRTVQPLMGQHSAFDLARMFYAQFNDINFEDDFTDYLRNGCVVSRPNLFCMAKPVEYKGEKAWFICMIVGNLLEAISCLPFFLEKTIFYRDNDRSKLRVVNTKRAIQLSVKLVKRC